MDLKAESWFSPFNLPCLYCGSVSILDCEANGTKLRHSHSKGHCSRLMTGSSTSTTTIAELDKTNRLQHTSVQLKGPTESIYSVQEDCISSSPNAFRSIWKQRHRDRDETDRENPHANCRLTRKFTIVNIIAHPTSLELSSFY